MRGVGAMRTRLVGLRPKIAVNCCRALRVLVRFRYVEVATEHSERGMRDRSVPPSDRAAINLAVVMNRWNMRIVVVAGSVRGKR